MDTQSDILRSDLPRGAALPRTWGWGAGQGEKGDSDSLLGSPGGDLVEAAHNLILNQPSALGPTSIEGTFL